MKRKRKRKKKQKTRKTILREIDARGSLFKRNGPFLFYVKRLEYTSYDGRGRDERRSGYQSKSSSDNNSGASGPQRQKFSERNDYKERRTSFYGRENPSENFSSERNRYGERERDSRKESDVERDNRDDFDSKSLERKSVYARKEDNRSETKKKYREDDETDVTKLPISRTKEIIG